MIISSILLSALASFSLSADAQLPPDVINALREMEAIRLAPKIICVGKGEDFVLSGQFMIDESGAPICFSGFGYRGYKDGQENESSDFVLTRRSECNVAGSGSRRSFAFSRTSPEELSASVEQIDGSWWMQVGTFIVESTGEYRLLPPHRAPCYMER